MKNKPQEPTRECCGLCRNKIESIHTGDIADGICPCHSIKPSVEEVIEDWNKQAEDLHNGILPQDLPEKECKCKACEIEKNPDLEHIGLVHSCHSIKPPKECCKESCPYLKCHTGRHGVVSTMCTDKCDCSCHSIKPPIATNSQDSYEVKDESKLTSQDLPEEECEVCKMFPEDGHPHEELSPELSWDIMKFIVTDGGWSSDIDVEKSNKKLSAFIKKVEQQAFNSGRASMVESLEKVLENGHGGGNWRRLIITLIEETKE